MSKRLAQYKAQLRAKRAAEMDLSLEEFDAYIDAEQRRIDEINRLTYDRTAQRSAIARHAVEHGRMFIKLSCEEHVHAPSPAA